MLDYARAIFARPEGANYPEPEPPRLDYLWGWFCQLSDWRVVGFSLGAISHLEIEAWARLMRIELFPSEVDALRRLDRAYRLHAQAASAPPKPNFTQGLDALAARNAARMKHGR